MYVGFFLLLVLVLFGGGGMWVLRWGVLCGVGNEKGTFVGFGVGGEGGFVVGFGGKWLRCWRKL